MSRKFVLIAGVVILLFGIGGCVGGSTSTTSSSVSISSFQSTPSDQFIVDMADVSRGSPFKGSNSASPHSGAHVHFSNVSNTWPRGGTAVSNYPPIYAAAAGTVSHVDTYYAVGSNYRYGINITIAHDAAGNAVDLAYSIEPMIDPGDSSFYVPYIQVSVGQTVTKGQSIAYMYLASGSSDGAHIHFNLLNGSTFTAPAIFTSTIVNQFYATWQSTTDGSATMPACMGYGLTAAENPFGTGAVTAL